MKIKYVKKVIKTNKTAYKSVKITYNIYKNIYSERSVDRWLKIQDTM